MDLVMQVGPNAGNRFAITSCTGSGLAPGKLKEAKTSISFAFPMSSKGRDLVALLYANCPDILIYQTNSNHSVTDAAVLRDVSLSQLGFSTLKAGTKGDFFITLKFGHTDAFPPVAGVQVTGASASKQAIAKCGFVAQNDVVRFQSATFEPTTFNRSGGQTRALFIVKPANYPSLNSFVGETLKKFFIDFGNSNLSFKGTGKVTTNSANAGVVADFVISYLD